MANLRPPRFMSARRALDGSSARLFLLILVGGLTAAALTFASVQFGHHRRLAQSHDFATAERIGDIAGARDDPTRALAETLPQAEAGQSGRFDPALTRAVMDALGRRGVDQVTIRAYEAAPSACGARPEAAVRCRLLRLQPRDGPQTLVAVVAPPLAQPWALGRDAMLMIALGLIVLATGAWIASRAAAEPLARLSRGALALGSDLDAPALDEMGPIEVRQAASALNRMRDRLRVMIADRTRVLAAVAHDLQTPLTRMRLRIEKVRDPALRAALAVDIAAMQQLVVEGLELARLEDTREDKVRVDLGALAGALCEDAADAGQPVVFTGGADTVVWTRPHALRRCLTNLIDNAVRHGGDAEVTIETTPRQCAIRVRDHGPGVPADQLERLFEPYFRLDASRSRDSGGSGLGLTIARRMAERAGAHLELMNAEGGGLEARVVFPPQ